MAVGVVTPVAKVLDKLLLLAVQFAWQRRALRSFATKMVLITRVRTENLIALIQAWWDKGLAMKVTTGVRCGLVVLFILLGKWVADGASADVFLTTTDAPDPVVVGGNLTFTFSITNRGTDTATGVVLTNPLVTSVILSSVVATNGSWTNLNNTFQYTLDSLSTGVLVVVKMIVTPVNTQMITNRSGLLANEPDPVPGNNRNRVNQTTVVPVASGANLVRGRMHHEATTLQDGRVLITGGWTNGSAGASATAELFNPQTEAFTFTGEMSVERYNHSATLLNDGRVLVVGGHGASGATANVDLYDPTNGIFTLFTNLAVARNAHSAIKLPDGRVLIAGGDATTTTVEVFNPADGSLGIMGNLQVPRLGQVAALLSDGKVLLVGGSTNPLSAEVFNPQAGTSTLVGNLVTNHTSLQASRLLDGNVLVFGGDQAEVFDATAETFSLSGAPLESRNTGRLTLLPDGRVLITGGINGMGFMPSTELFDPATATFAAGPPMTRARYAHSAALMNDGRVLLAGGFEGVLLGSSEYVVITMDLDRDGMADDWEVSYGLSPADRNDAVQDADLDGHSNLQEYLAGTNPLDANSNMRVSIVQTAPTTVRIGFTTVAGKRYAVESTTNLLSQAWDVVTNNVLGSGAVLQVNDTHVSDQTRRLYRVRLIP